MQNSGNTNSTDIVLQPSRQARRTVAQGSAKFLGEILAVALNRRRRLVAERTDEPAE